MHASAYAAEEESSAAGEGAALEDGDPSGAGGRPAQGSGEDDAVGGAEVALSKNKAKLQNRLTVAELKQLVSTPDLVESHDVTAR